MDFKPGDRVQPNAVFFSLCPPNIAAWSPGTVLTAEEAAKHLGRGLPWWWDDGTTGRTGTQVHV